MHSKADEMVSLI